MDMNQIHYFIKVAECGSFSEAAEQLFTTQSSVSKHIKALEKELNVQLFDRSNRKIKLTDAGSLALADAVRLSELHAHMIHSLTELSAQTNGALSIASIPVMAQYNITGLIADFTNSYPNIHLNIQEIEGVDIAARLKEENFNFAFMRIDHLERSFDCLPLFEDRLCVVVSKQHPLSNEKKLSLTQLSKESFLLLNKWTMLYDLCILACKSNGFTPNVTYTGTRMDSILDLVGKNQGISLLMTHAVAYSRNENTVLIPLAEEYKSTVGLVRVKQKALSASARTFWDFIKTHAL